MIDDVQRRWQRRYGDPEPIGPMAEQFLALDIALRRVLHALRPTFRPTVRRIFRLLDR